MSYVTDIVCLFSWDEDVPDWFWASPGVVTEREWDRFTDIAGYGGPADDPEGGTHHAFMHWGGGKAPQGCVLAGAFNWINHDKWLANIAAQAWPGDERPVIAIHTEHDTEWTAYLWNGSAFTAPVAAGSSSETEEP